MPGTIYSSSLFPNRAPEERVLLLNYIGGAQFTQITEKVMSHSKITTEVLIHICFYIYIYKNDTMLESLGYS